MPKTLKELDNLMNTFEFKQTSSFWLQDAIDKLKNRDICDVLNDIEFLHIYFTAKFNEFAATTHSNQVSPFDK